MFIDSNGKMIVKAEIYEIIKLDGRYEIPEYEPGESSLLDKLHKRDYWPQ